jgi:hypothetical protein
MALTVATGGPPGSLVGLDRARVVVEYPIAADHTGLLVLLDSDAKVLGPLRSATPSDAALAIGFTADLVTARTTGAVVEHLAQADLSVFEEHTVRGALVRDPARRAPFNLYVVPEAVRAAVGQRDPGVPWSPDTAAAEAQSEDGRSGDGRSGEVRAQDEVTVQVAGDAVVTWTWEPNESHWLRTAGGQLEQSATGARIAADIVLVLEVRSDLDRPPAIADLVGSGTAQVLRNGQVSDASWQRSGTTDLPTVRGSGDAPAGTTTWVHVCAFPCA